MITNTGNRVPLYPWSELYTNVYIFLDKKDNRRFVILKNRDKKKFLTTYARYLYTSYLGEWIPEHLEVDHINNDSSDDRIENYQLLTQVENIKKFHEYRISLLQSEYTSYINEINTNRFTNTIFEFIPNTISVNFKCNHCGELTTVYCCDIKSKIARGQKNFYCSKKCQEKASSYLYSRSDLIDNIEKLSRSGKYSAEIQKQLNISHEVIKKYRSTPLVDGRTNCGHGNHNKNCISNVTIKLINEFARQGLYLTQIARTLKIDKASVIKYCTTKLSSGVKEGNSRLIKKETKEKINKLAQEGKSCHQISLLVGVSFSTVKKYSKVPLAHGWYEANQKKLKQGLIDKINNYSPDISNSQIADMLNIDQTTVKRYRITEYRDGRRPSIEISNISKTSKDIIIEINSIENKDLSSRSLARKLNIDRSTIKRYRIPDNINSDTLMSLREAIEYRKSNLTLKQIRDRLGIGKNTMSIYANYINNDIVKEKLLNYNIETYTEGVISEAIEKNTASDIGTNNNNNYIPFGLDCIKAYSAYDEMQARALKIFYESSGDFTIYSTIETTNSDDIFLTISGTK